MIDKATGPQSPSHEAAAARVPVALRPCSICGDKPRSSRAWCARCWRLYRRAKRQGKDTVLFLQELRSQYAEQKRLRLAS